MTGKKRPCTVASCKGTEYHTGFGDVWSCKDCAKREEDAERRSPDKVAGDDFIIIFSPADEEPTKPQIIIGEPIFY